MPVDSCGAQACGPSSGWVRSWQLPSSTKSLMLELPVSPLSTRILLGRTARAASGLAGPLVHRHFFQHVPPRLPGGWISWPVFRLPEAGQSCPSHCRAS